MSTINEDFFENDEQVENHHLSGWIYAQTAKVKYKDEWKRQLIRNQLVGKEVRSLGASLQKNETKVTLLKGFALIGQTYVDWGARFASDVDLLVRKIDLDVIDSILVNHGFIKRVEEQWKGDDFKSVYLKATPLLEIIIEVHTRLYWHRPERSYQSRTSQIFIDYDVLEIEEQLLHLCGHLAFQHSFLKLFWLLDIEIFLKQHHKRVDWNLFWTLAEKDSLKISSYLCLWLVDSKKQFWSFKDKRLGLLNGLKVLLLKKALNKSFLLSPKRSMIRYLFVKTLIKDRLSQSFDYYLSWTKVH